MIDTRSIRLQCAGVSVLMRFNCDIDYQHVFAFLNLVKDDGEDIYILKTESHFVRQRNQAHIICV